MLGTIVTWFEKRNYGFIRPDDLADEEIFVHGTDTPNRQPLLRDTRVSFEFGKFGGRIKAVKIVIVAVPR
jgi:cold shock CspA family protein